MFFSVSLAIHLSLSLALALRSSISLSLSLLMVKRLKFTPRKTSAGTQTVYRNKSSIRVSPCWTCSLWLKLSLKHPDEVSNVECISRYGTKGSEVFVLRIAPKNSLDPLWLGVKHGWLCSIPVSICINGCFWCNLDHRSKWIHSWIHSWVISYQTMFDHRRVCQMSGRISMTRPATRPSDVRWEAAGSRPGRCGNYTTTWTW